MLMAAMAMALMVVVMALPALAAPPQEGDFVGGEGGGCTVDSTGAGTCIGGGGSHQVGSQSGGGSGGRQTRSPEDQNLANGFSGGSGGGGSPESGVEPGGFGEHCVPNSDGQGRTCVGSPGVT
jgi:hypothetical protein